MDNDKQTIARLERRSDLATSTAAAFLFHCQQAHPECGCKGRLDEYFKEALDLTDDLKREQDARERALDALESVLNARFQGETKMAEALMKASAALKEGGRG